MKWEEDPGGSWRKEYNIFVAGFYVFSAHLVLSETEIWARLTLPWASSMGIIYTNYTGGKDVQDIYNILEIIFCLHPGRGLKESFRDGQRLDLPP